MTAHAGWSTAARGRGRGGGVRLRRRDGSGRQAAGDGSGRQAAGGGGARPAADATADVSPAVRTATAAALDGPAQTTRTRRGPVARLTEPDACISCGVCVDVCPRAAVRLDDVAVVHEDLCTGCGQCVDACPAGALGLVVP